MRAVLAFLLLCGPAYAWEFTPTPICTLSNDADGVALRVTYDPRQQQPYAINITRAEPWPDAPQFSLSFEGGRDQTISTPLHELSADGRTMTVRDSGFGNVLNGLEFNSEARAIADAVSVPISLNGAAPTVQAFRACLDAPSA